MDHEIIITVTALLVNRTDVVWLDSRCMVGNKDTFGDEGGSAMQETSHASATHNNTKVGDRIWYRVRDMDHILE